MSSASVEGGVIVRGVARGLSRKFGFWPKFPAYRSICPESDLGDLELDVAAVDDDFLDRAMGDAVQHGGLLLGGECRWEADFGLEAAQRQRAAGTGKGLAADLDAGRRDAQFLAGLLGIDRGAAGQRGVE